MTTATATESRWVIRPVQTPTAGRRYLPVAFVDGQEIEVYEAGVRSFETVQAARVFIVRKFDGGRRFPAAPVPFVRSAASLAEDSRIADAFKGIKPWRD